MLSLNLKVGLLGENKKVFRQKNDCVYQNGFRDFSLRVFEDFAHASAIMAGVQFRPLNHHKKISFAFSAYFAFHENHSQILIID